MPENPPERSSSPDVRTIHRLVRLMHRYDLTAIDVVEGQTTIRLRRRSEAPGTGAVSANAASPAVNLPAPATGRLEAAAASSAEAGTIIECPMVGTFYASPAPDAPAFVSVGSVVRPDTVVCVIEAMKVFTDIPAGVSGTITDVLVKNGEPVEYGQPLFRISPA